jgi:hypothetical protein
MSYQCTRIHDNSGTQCNDCGCIQINAALCPRCGATMSISDVFGHEKVCPAEQRDTCSATLTVSAEWPDFLTAVQAARREYRAHHVERIAVVDLANLTIGRVIAFEKHVDTVK